MLCNTLLLTALNVAKFSVEHPAKLVNMQFLRSDSYATEGEKMSHNTLDLRVRRTRKLLRNALVDLIEEKGYESLKVSEIADRAMINRATFYRHYNDKADLLTHCMDDAFKELKANAAPPHTAAGDLDHSAPGTNLHAMLQHVANNINFYRIMLGPDAPGAFVNRLRAFLREVSAERWQMVAPHAEGPHLPSALVVSFVASAYIGVIVWWVERDCQVSVEQMAKHLERLTLHGPYRALGMTPPE
jgi:AcrR family transcriptional regulator